jgi:hypothetical protein
MSLTQEAISRLAGQFQDKPKLKAMMEAIVGPLDDVLADLDALKTQRWIDTAIGAQLDGCGSIVGETRKGRGDDEYRAAIKFRVFVNVSTGTPADIQEAISYLIGGDDRQYLEVYPATVLVFSDGPNPPKDIQAQIQDIAPAAISTIPVMVSYTEKPFRFGREGLPSELFVNDQYLTADGSDLQLSTGQNTVNGATLGGLVPADISANDSLIELSDGSILVVNSPNHDILLDSGHHLTGVFQ